MIILKKEIKIQGETPKRVFYIKSSDIVQWRYEMIRQATLRRDSIDKVCKEFNYSRDMYFYYKKKFEEMGMRGLFDEKRGPKKKHKRTENFEKKLIEIRWRYPDFNMYEIAKELKEEGFLVSPRSVARTLSDFGLTLKKMKEKHLM